MKKLSLLLVALGLAACAPRYSAATQKPVDTMTCAEMQAEYAKLQSIRAEAEGKRGVSKENVAWAILFWPGAVFNEMDNREVVAKVDARAQTLSEAAPAKGCKLQ